MFEKLFGSLLSNFPGEWEEETFEYQKNNVKTIFTFRFDSEGYPVSTSWKSTYTPTSEEKTINQLRLDLKEAVAEEDFEKALEIKKRIKTMEEG